MAEYRRFFAAFTELTDFYQSIDDLPRIKVAILDTGIDSMHDDVRSNIKGGASFVRAQGGNSVLPWFTALDAHGTQMASLIVNVNPFCDLYIYRVCSWPWDINATAAVNVCSYFNDPEVLCILSPCIKV
jgi:subtilisin family serine protease